MNISISQNIHRVSKIRIRRDAGGGSSWLNVDFIDGGGEIFNVSVFPADGDARDIEILNEVDK